MTTCAGHEPDKGSLGMRERDGIGVRHFVSQPLHLQLSAAGTTHCVRDSRSVNLKGSLTALNPNNFMRYTAVAKSAPSQLPLAASKPSTIPLPFCNRYTQQSPTCSHKELNSRASVVPVELNSRASVVA